MLFNTMQRVIHSTYRARIYAHPFNQALYNGTLPIHSFYNFLEQDKPYLNQFSKSLLCLAKRVTHIQHRHMLMQLSHYILNTEAKMHDKYLLANNPMTFFSRVKYNNTPNKVVTAYLWHIHRATEIESIPVAIASLIPCFYIYSSLGLYMQQQGVDPNNIYRHWIESYSNPSFLTATQSIITILNELTAHGIDNVHSSHIMNVFIKSVLFEIALWDSVCHKIPCIHPHQPDFKF